MPSIPIRNLDEALKSQLRVRAAQHGRSMEDEARDILRTALSRRKPIATSLAESIHARFAPFGEVELQIPPREPMRGASLATRNTTDFEACGIELINPWGEGV